MQITELTESIALIVPMFLLVDGHRRPRRVVRHGLQGRAVARGSPPGWAS